MLVELGLVELGLVELGLVEQRYQAVQFKFTDYYNTARPHRAIDRQTPAAAWNARPRATPARQGVQISDHYRVRKDRVAATANSPCATTADCTTSASDTAGPAPAS